MELLPGRRQYPLDSQVSPPSGGQPKLEWRRTPRWWAPTVVPSPCTSAHPHVNVLAHAQALTHAPERPGGLFADHIRRRAPSHNNGPPTRWPARCARAGSQLQRRRLILTFYLILIFCILLSSNLENLIHQKMKYLSLESRLAVFVSKYKCGKITGTNLGTQKNGRVVMWS